MKHTDFYTILQAIKYHEEAELMDAVNAHGGSVTLAQVDEAGHYNESGCPIVLAASKYDESARDYSIVKVTVEMADGKDWLTIYGIDKEYGYEPEPVEVEPGHIGYIIDSIPETQQIKDVSKRFPLVN